MTLEHMKDLKVEVQVPTPGMQNLIQNPDGELGAWGWESPVDNTSIFKHGFWNVLAFKTDVSQPAYWTSEPFKVTAGRYYVARFGAIDATAGHNVKVRMEWLDANKAYMSSSIQSASYAALFTHHWIPAQQAPTGAVYGRIRFDFYNGTGNPAAWSQFIFSGVMVAGSVTAAGFGSVRRNLYRVGLGPGWFGKTLKDVTATNTGTPAAQMPDTSSGGVVAYHQKYSLTGRANLDVQSFYSDAVSGQYYTASTYVKSETTGSAVYCGIEFLGADYVPVGYSMGTTMESTTTGWTRVHAIARAPQGTQFVRMRLQFADAMFDERHFVDGTLFEQTNMLKDYFDGDTPDVTGITYAWEGTGNLRTSVATYASTSFDYQPPAAWLPITGSAINVEINRESLNLGTMSVALKNENLDPSVYDPILQPGKRIRMQSRAGSDWKNLFNGRINNAKVDYEKPKKPNAAVESIITITANDAMADLVNHGESRSVATIEELPLLLEGKGIAWNCNGITSHITDGTVVATNDNASVADQVAITRDTERGHAWVDKDGVLQVWNGLSWKDHDFIITDRPLGENVDANVWPNPSFESADLSHLTAFNGTMARSTAAAKTGTYGLRYTVTGTGYQYVGTGPDIEGIPEGRFWKVTSWVRPSVATTVNTEFNDPVAGYLPIPANTWTQLVTYTHGSSDGKTIYGTWWFTDLPVGATVDIDDISITQVVPDAFYSDIDADWDTDEIMNQVELKHLTTNADGNAEEVVIGTYEDAASVAKYGAKRATFTLVGEGATVPDFQTFASEILYMNAQPVVRARTVRIPVKDEKSLVFAAAVDISHNINVMFGDVFPNAWYSYFRVQSLKHTIDANGWFIDITFYGLLSNPAPQYTPAPPVKAAEIYDTGWVTPTLQNSWAHSSEAPVAYRRIGDQVWFRGYLTGGTVTATMFQVPADCRPTQNGLFPTVIGSPSVMYLRVRASDGAVYVDAGNNAYVLLDGVRYLTS